VRECGRRGVGAASVVAAGFAEAGEAGRQLNRELLAAQRETGVRILGPNTAGLRVIDSADRALFATQAADPARGFLLGPTAMLSQSGGLSIYLGATQLAARGVGSRYIIDTGNEVDIDLADCLSYIAPDPKLRCIGLVAEGARDGRKLRDAVATVTGHKKAVVVLKLARHDAAARFAQSHTGVLAGRAGLFESELREAGALIASDEQELIEAMTLHATDRVPGGRRLGAVASSGGMCVLLLDLAAANGFELPAPELEPAAELLAALPFSGVGNPLDVAGYMTAGPRALEAAVRYLADQPNIDAVVLAMAEIGDAEFDALSRLALATRKPIYYGGARNPRYTDRLRDIGVIQFELPSRMMRALNVATRHPSSQPRSTRATQVASSVTTAAARDQLREYPDLALVAGHSVSSAAAASAIQRKLEAPIVLKADSDKISHKTEQGLVSPPVAGAEVIEAYARLLLARDASADPEAQIVVQPYVEGVELALGAYRDLVFGPTVMVATGGIFLEVLDDAVFAAAPIDEDKANAMIHRLRGFPILAGARGRAPADVPGAARALVALSRFINEHEEYESIDVNPLIVRELGAGALAVDLLAIRRRS
jgi:acyl-CoA synthetase (NDP forming)